MAKSRLLLDLTSGDRSIFKEIAGMTEEEQRKLLRVHRDVTLKDKDAIRKRGRLRIALNDVMRREVAMEVGALSEAEAGLASVPGLIDLLASNPFVRYTDTYLALNMRFVASRLNVRPGPDDACLNELPVARPCPPGIPDTFGRSAEDECLRFFTAERAMEADADIKAARHFLDDFRRAPEKHSRFELWLRGLSGPTRHEGKFQQIVRGLMAFASRKAAFYEPLEDVALAVWRSSGCTPGGLCARNPLTARFGLYDLYWFARLLRGEVTPTGAVTFANGSWLQLLAIHRRGTSDEKILNDQQALISSVLDFACDLVQNASDIVAAELEARATPDGVRKPVATCEWREAFDEELIELDLQRQARGAGLRETLHGNVSEGGVAVNTAPCDDTRWSRRIRTGEHVHELVGVAVSGGGIRSATFGLGVLQRLQELDLLRKVDYLSTVSGGGYIGSWLVGSVHRNRYWLTQPTDWGPSIAHLRRYSNYLAPRTGLLSADTWAMWGSWIRNTVLVQLSATLWLALMMTLVGLGRVIFDWQPAFEWQATILSFKVTYPRILAGLTTVALPVLAFLIDRRVLKREASYSEANIQLWLVLPSLVGAFLASSAMWLTRDWRHPEFGHVLITVWRDWIPLLAALFLSLLALGLRSANVKRFKALLAVSAALGATGISYLAGSAVYWLYSRSPVEQFNQYVWYAYVFGPSLMLLAMSLGVTIMIGILGHDSEDWRREWWTRLGAWLGIYAAGFLAVGVGAVFGPLALLKLFGAHPGWSASTVLGWVGTVVGGLFGGHSEQSDGENAKSTTAKLTSLFARFAAVAFIVGGVFLVATVVHVVLVNIADVSTIGDEVYWDNLDRVTWRELGVAALVLAVIGSALSWRFDLNVFGLNQFYRNRLVRCYLGATRWVPGLRKPHPFTGFDALDDINLADLRNTAPGSVERRPFAYRGPFPIINGALNLGGSSDLELHTRHSASFTMTPLRCGSSRVKVGFAPTRRPGGESFGGGVTLGQAVSISGAAASPNMGYDTSPLVSFLLTMFNVRLAWWFPNPARGWWSLDRLGFGLLSLIKETFGLADETSKFVNVSDGGHFENLGIYELVRRRCKVIIASDGECDDKLTFGSLGRVIRMCRTDFNAAIDIDVESIRRDPQTGLSRAHCAVGRITYANGSRGYLIYLKSSVTGDEDVDVQQYRASHPDFPHESTGDQFFAEDQFESYRKLGYHVTSMTFRGAEDRRNVTAMGEKLANLWVAESAESGDFVERTQALVELWDRMRATPGLIALFRELHGVATPDTPPQRAL
ncbi:MAG TPA: patatin-like phospholipase family protein, partial [Vicinamibacterales bacterium]|nr:patatin-like phospholipase family protein [Vicinamibacterales bacterium]